MADHPPQYPDHDPAPGWSPAQEFADRPTEPAGAGQAPPIPWYGSSPVYPANPAGAPVDPYPDAGFPTPGAGFPAELYPTTPYPQPPAPVGYLPLAYPATPTYGQQLLQPATVTVVVTPATSGMATASMVLGIIGLVFACFSCGIPSLLAIIFGHIGISQTKNQARGGRGYAIAGLIMGYALIIPAVLATGWVLTHFGVGVGARPPYNLPTRPGSGS
jgi:hypothetical protein